MTTRIAIGFGATSSARADDVVALVRLTLATPVSGPALVAGAVIATIDRRADLARDVSRQLGCAYVLFDAATLARVAESTGVATKSPRALDAVATPSVAEAAALAALDARARLIARRRTGHNCTCAIAEKR